MTIENDVVEEHKVDDHLDPGLHRKSQSSLALSLLQPALPFHFNGGMDHSFPTFSSLCDIEEINLIRQCMFASPC